MPIAYYGLFVLVDVMPCQILFLNKNDLFEAKVEHSDIKTFFPVRVSIHIGSYLALIVIIKDYDGESKDIVAGREYFKKRFARLAQKAGRSKEREIYIQYAIVLVFRTPSVLSCV